MILCDTRQQADKHLNIDSYFKKTGIPVDRCGLYVGDYVIANSQARSVDTKQDVLELAKDIMSSDHERFRRECERAQNAGIALLILTEEQLPSGGLSEWQSPTTARGVPLTRASGESLKRAMLTMTAKYGVRFRFCRPSDTGRIIVEYLTEGVLP